MISDLEKSILKTICYFDAMAYPLTLMEIFKWLDAPAEISAVQWALGQNNLAKVLASRSGFYFLAGRENLASERLRRYALADKKFKKAIKVIKFLRFFPWLKAIAVYSLLSFSNSRPEGDIDLFVVSASNRLWSARFFINVFLKFFRLRPTARTSQNKICVSFLVSVDGLDLSLIDEPHYDYSHSQFIFLFNRNNLAGRFFAANPRLVKRLSNFFPYFLNSRRRIDSNFFWLQKFGEIIFGFLPEKYYRRFQLLILPQKFKKIINLDKRVILSDTAIKLHDQDKIRGIQMSAENKFQELCNANT